MVKIKSNDRPASKDKLKTKRKPESEDDDREMKPKKKSAPSRNDAEEEAGPSGREKPTIGTWRDEPLVSRNFTSRKPLKNRVVHAHPSKNGSHSNFLYTCSWPPDSSASTGMMTSHIKNKMKRSEMYQKLKAKAKKLKKEVRKKKQKEAEKAEQLGLEAPPKQIPRTIENTREADDTMVDPQDDEVEVSEQ